MLYSLATEQTKRITAAPRGFQTALGGAWSPNGRRIAFVGWGETGSDLFTVRPNGTHLRRLTSTPNLYETSPNWSPGGGRLIYARTTNSDCVSLHTIEPDGTDRRRVRPGCGFEEPVWSPNGRKIAATRDREDRPRVWIMSRDGSRLRFVVSGSSPDWRPLR